MKLFTAKCLTVFSVIFIAALCGCTTISKTYNMKKCEYTYKSLTNVTIGGVNASNGISLVDAPKILLLLNSQNSSIPLSFLLTLDVKNPTDSEAAFHGMTYKINIDGMDFSDGSIDEPFSVAAGATKPLSLKIGTDVAELIRKHSREKVLNMVQNFVGLGSDKTTVHVELKPKVLVGTQVVTSPVTFPVDFTFGGKK
ncbi:MAG: LEA type 2 family protein [Leptospirales bacterium]|nr:LEA type 2 family protein [Leptospirales bacterium]